MIKYEIKILMNLNDLVVPKYKCDYRYKLVRMLILGFVTKGVVKI